LFGGNFLGKHCLGENFLKKVFPQTPFQKLSTVKKLAVSDVSAERQGTVCRSREIPHLLRIVIILNKVKNLNLITSYRKLSIG
jgi:hypothetical protein